MAMLKTEDIVFSRDTEGALIPQEITLETMENKPTIKIVPLTKGQLNEIHTMAKSSDPIEKIKADNNAIKIGLIAPKLTDEQISDLKPKYSGAIAIAIMSVTLGINQKEISEKTADAIQDMEAELKKK